MSQNYSTFRGLLRSAICTRTQAQFANESGISAEHLSRMLNLDTIHRPNNTTLHKIASAAKNGVTFQDLMDALDTDDGTVRKFKTSEECKEPEMLNDTEREEKFRKDATTCMEKLSKLIKATAYPVMFKSVADYVVTLIQECNGNDMPLQIAYDIGEPRLYIGTKHEYADKYVPIYLSMADYRSTATSRMIVYFTDITSGDGNKQYAIQGSSVTVADIEDLFGMPPAALTSVKNTEDDAEALDKAYALPWYLDFEAVERFRERYVPRNEKDDKKRFIESIFGTEIKRPMSYYGIGFTIEKAPEKLAKFLHNHKIPVLSQLDSMPEKRKKLEKALSDWATLEDNQGIADELDKMEYIDENCESDYGWQAAVATIMADETGFPFKYHEATTSEDEVGICLSREGCIMVEEEDAIEMRIRRETLLLAVCRYANALGIKQFGDIMHTNLRTWYNKPMTYNVKEPKNDEETEEKNEIKYSVLFTKDGERPKDTGMYHVELKDGRHMRMLYLKDNNAWVMCHKEWSHMIAAYCPDMIKIPETTE